LAPPGIHLVLAREHWQTALAEGQLRTPSLTVEGFIHAATGEQISGVLARHFHGQCDLLLLTLDRAALAGVLRWEPGRDGELYPHIYSAIPLAWVQSAESLPDR
jgi:uncharacterized protein (DUF952 family)